MKILALLALILTMLQPGAGCLAAATNPTALVVSGPPVAESLVFAIMAAQHPGQVSYLPWHSPDQARAFIAGGKVNAAIVTTTGAATLYNRGVELRIAAVFPVPLWLISTQPQVGTVPLKGRLIFPFGHREMPELIFHAVYGDDFPDLTKLHCGSALEAVNRLLLGKAEHAVLAEPAATMALMKSGRDGQPQLVKNLNLGQGWQDKYPQKPLYVSALAVFQETVRNKTALENLLALYEKTRHWMVSHPNETLAIARDKAPAIYAQLNGLNEQLAAAPAHSARSDFDATLFFLERMYTDDPEIVGGERPDRHLFLEIDH